MFSSVLGILEERLSMFVDVCLCSLYQQFCLIFDLQPFKNKLQVSSVILFFFFLRGVVLGISVTSVVV